MSESTIKKYHRTFNKQNKKIAASVKIIHYEFIRTIKSYSLWKRLGIAWDIVIKGK